MSERAHDHTGSDLASNERQQSEASPDRRRMLVSYDGSPDADEALREAGGIAPAGREADP